MTAEGRFDTVYRLDLTPSHLERSSKFHVIHAAVDYAVVTCSATQWHPEITCCFGLVGMRVGVSQA